MTVKEALLQEYEKAIKEILGELANEEYTEDTDCDISSDDLEEINNLVKVSMNRNEPTKLRKALINYLKRHIAYYLRMDDECLKKKQYVKAYKYCGKIAELSVLEVMLSYDEKMKEFIEENLKEEEE